MDMIPVVNSSTNSSQLHDKFRNFQLQEEFDTHVPEAISFTSQPFLRKRSKIIEIVAAKDMMLYLLLHTSNKRICYLNMTPDQVIRSLFYNKKNESLITVSVHATDNFTSLKCRSTSIEYIKRNQLDAGVVLFKSESLELPDFVEFDDVNGKGITYSARDSIYKVFDLKDYSFLYSISDKNVLDIKISPGTMLVTFQRDAAYVPLRIISIEDGTLIKSLTHLLHPNKKIDFIELFNEKLLIKQEHESLQILDVSNSELTEMVTSFEDHLLWKASCNLNKIYITNDQDIIFSYCEAEGAEEDGKCAVGSIHISSILSGNCIAKICSNNPNLWISPRGRMGGRPVTQSNAREALEDVTVVFYNEDCNEVYSGNRKGLLHVWSNAQNTSKI
ncbi:hypothetical protein AQUCO_02000552v1 [Aquilegia coerulea]|uniref:Uncharacterized protein n=1 Tax=Aquilegia coerulea TaxID=218851 RepID=A0A2G5DI27_AQUCA|nr:hypothetical protein AQUCO_02000552v1 [Aquilegia coerulea]